MFERYEPYANVIVSLISVMLATPYVVATISSVQMFFLYLIVVHKNPFTTYLSGVSETFKTKVGANSSVEWPSDS